MSAVAIAVVAATCGAIASRRLMSGAPQYARVIAVTPISRQVRMPHEVCKSEEVKHVRPELDAREQPAQHSGRDSRKDDVPRENDTYTTTEEHCATVFETVTQALGYEVRYRLDGREGRIHMDHAPGSRILLRDGQLVSGESAAAPKAAGST